MIKEPTIVMKEMPGVPNSPSTIRRIQKNLYVASCLPLLLLASLGWLTQANSLYIFAFTFPAAVPLLSLLKTIQSWTDPTRRYRYLIDDDGIRVESTLSNEKVTRKVSSWKDIHTVDLENGGVTLRGKWRVVLPMPFECFESVEQRDQVVALVTRQAVNATRKAIE